MSSKHATAKRTECAQGHAHGSRIEARRCNDLHLLQAANVISGLQIQPKIPFVIDGRQVVLSGGRKAAYTGDFAYVENGVKVIEEVKPAAARARARDYPLRIAIAKHLFPSLDFREVV